MITSNGKIYFKEQTVTPVIEAVQGDSGRNLSLEAADYLIPAGAALTYYVQKPSGEAVYNNASRIDDKTIAVPLTAQSLAEVGACIAQVRVGYDEEIITSQPFILCVRPFEGEGAVESTTEMNIFDQEVENVKDEIAQLIPIKPGTGTRSIRANDHSTNTASGGYSFASGSNTTASGTDSFAGNVMTTASGGASYAIGMGTIANHMAQVAFGTFNVADTSTASAGSKGTYVELVGNGQNEVRRSNARTLDWNGNETLAGKLTVGANPTSDMDAATKGYVDGVSWTAVDANNDGNIVIQYRGG